MTSNHHAPAWATRATMDRTKGSETARLTNPQICSQFGSQSATRLREAGIAKSRISMRGEYVPGLVHTARHHEFVTPKSVR